MTSDDSVIPAHFAPGTMGCHEALHMAMVCAEMVDERLCEHPAVGTNPAWKVLADKARDTLHELYQAVGDQHLSAEWDG